MKTANPPVRPAILLTLLAGLTVAIGITPTRGRAAEGEQMPAPAGNILMAADVPDQYVVKVGDTLWDIAKVFLRDPWYWPEIWHVNPQVENPHLIFPGDTLRLVYLEGEPKVTVGERGEPAQQAAAARPQEGGHSRLSPQVRREPLSAAITAIPYHVIASFMGRPTLLEKEQVKKAPYVVAMRDDHVIGAAGNEIYARGIRDAAVDTRYNIIHVEERLYDPQTRDLLGYSGMYVGSGPVVTAGDPAKLTLGDSTREALQGDKLFAQSVDVNADFVPHAPSSDVDAHVIAVRSHTIMGQYQVVALNRGTKAGLEPGHVLAVHQVGELVRDTYAGGGMGTRDSHQGFRLGRSVKLPEERVGVVMVFKAFERMSYALVMESTHEIRQGDLARNP
jgi:LysM domain-containing protein